MELDKNVVRAQVTRECAPHEFAMAKPRPASSCSSLMLAFSALSDAGMSSPVPQVLVSPGAECRDLSARKLYLKLLEDVSAQSISDSLLS